MAFSINTYTLVAQDASTSTKYEDSLGNMWGHRGYRWRFVWVGVGGSNLGGGLSRTLFLFNIHSKQKINVINVDPYWIIERNGSRNLNLFRTIINRLLQINLIESHSTLYVDPRGPLPRICAYPKNFFLWFQMLAVAPMPRKKTPNIINMRWLKQRTHTWLDSEKYYYVKLIRPAHEYTRTVTTT